MRYCIMAVMAVCAQFAWAEEGESEAVELSRSAQRTIDRMDDAIGDAYEDFQKEVDKIKKKYLKDLRDEQEKLAKSGKLEEAMALKSTADAIEVKGAHEFVAEISVPKDFLGKPIKRPLNFAKAVSTHSTWKTELSLHPGRYWITVFSPDGTGYQTNSSGGDKVALTWEVAEAHLLIAVATTGTSYSVAMLPKEGHTYSGERSRGGTVSFSPLK